ncbi:MAG: MATE family efflux transporter [Oscillospiraceae bacterium]
MKENVMLVGKPAKTLLLFSLPILAGNLLQQFYSMVDSVVVGNYVSSNALASVGGMLPLVFMVTCVSFGLANGASILIGQYFGASQKNDMNRLVLTSLTYSAVIAFVLTVLGLVFSRNLVALLDTPAVVFEDSLLYIRIYFLGLIFTFCFNMISSVFRSLGDSKTPLVFLALASILNIILDLVFVIVFEMGVSGVAIATVISQGVAFLLQMLLLRKKLLEYSGVKKQSLRESFFDKRTFGQLTRLVIPTTSQELLISFGMLFTQKFVNGFGPDVMASYTATSKIVDFAMLPMIGMSIALTVFAAQNVGAGMSERVTKGYRAAMIFNMSVAAVLAAVVLVFGKPLIGAFVGAGASDMLYESGTSFLFYSSFSFVMMALLFAAEGVMKGAGDVNFFMVFAIIGSVVKVVASLMLMPTMGYSGIWAGILIGWSVEAILTTMRFVTGKWKTKRLDVGNNN